MSKLKLLILIAIFNIFCFYGCEIEPADPMGPDILWTRTYDSIQDGWTKSFTPTYDSHYLMGGSWRDLPNNVGGGFIMEIDENGNSLWTKFYPDSIFGGGIGAIKTSDGGYLAGSRTYTNIHIGTRLAKLDSAGNIIWDMEPSGGWSLSSYKFLETSDHNYLATMSNRSGALENISVLKLSLDGQVIWEKSFGAGVLDYVSSIQEQSDGYLIGGALDVRSADGHMSLDAFLFKFSFSGDTLWTHNYALPDDQWTSFTSEVNEGDLIIGGAFESLSGLGRGTQLMRIDNYGNVRWQRTYLEQGFTANSLITNEQGDMLLLGRQNNQTSIAKIAEDGTWLWSRNYDLPHFESSYSIAIPDGSVLLGGTEYPYQSRPMIVKLESITEWLN